MRSPVDRNFVSYSPARTSTGTAISPSRSHRGSWVPVPVARRLAAKAPAVLRSRSSRRAVCFVSPAKRAVPSHSSMKVSTPTASMWSALVSGPAGQTLVDVVDPGGGADQHECSHSLGVCERRVQRHPATHRVADVGCRTAGIDESPGALPEVGIGRWGSVTVAGQIDRDGLGARQPLLQEPGERRPRSCGLRETVGENKPIDHDCWATAWSAILRSTCANVSGSCAPGIAH